MKPIPTIGLPNDHSCTIKTYVASWRALRQMDPETEVQGWEWYPVKAREILLDLSASVHDRINRGGTGCLYRRSIERKEKADGAAQKARKVA